MHFTMVVQVMIVKMMMRIILKILKQSFADFPQSGILKNFANLTGKQQCWSFFLMKLLALIPSTLLKTYFNTGVFLQNMRTF